MMFLISTCILATFIIYLIMLILKDIDDLVVVKNITNHKTQKETIQFILWRILGRLGYIIALGLGLVSIVIQY